MNIVAVFLLVIAQASLRSCRTPHSVSLVHDTSSDIALVTPHKVPTLAQLIPILEGQDPPETKIRKLKKLIPIYDELNKWRIENNKRLVEILPFKKKVKPLALILAGNDFVKVKKAEDNSLDSGDIHRKKLKSNKHKRKPKNKHDHKQENSFETHHSNVERKLNKYSESYSDSISESDSEGDSPQSNEIEDGNTHVYQINLNPNKPNSETHKELVHDSPSQTVESVIEGLRSHRSYFAPHSYTPTIKPHSTPMSDIDIQQFEPFSRETDVDSHKHTDTNDSELESNEISKSAKEDGDSDSISEHSSSEAETSKVDTIELDENADFDLVLHDKTKPVSIIDYYEKESVLKEKSEKSTSDAELNESISDVNRKGSVESKETESVEYKDSIFNEKSSQFSLGSEKNIESNSDMNSENSESRISVESNESKSTSESNNNESKAVSDDPNVTDENSNNSVSDVSNESVFDANSEPESYDIESNDESVSDVKSSIPDESIEYNSLNEEDFHNSKSISDESLSDVSKSESISESNASGSDFDTASVSKEESDVESNELSVSNENSNEPVSSSGFIPNQIPNESILIPYADNDLEFDMESIKSNEVYKPQFNLDSNEYESVYVESSESLESKYDPELNENVRELYPTESEESIIEGYRKHIHLAPNANDDEHDVFVKGNHYSVADDSDFNDKTVDNIRRVTVTPDDSEFDDNIFDGHMVDNRRVATSNYDASKFKIANKVNEHHKHEHVNDDKVAIKPDQSAETNYNDEHVSINQEDHIQVSQNGNITDRDGDNEETASNLLEKNYHHQEHHHHHQHRHHDDTEPTPKPVVVKENSEQIEQISRLVLDHQYNKVPIVCNDDKVEENHEAPIFRVELMKQHNNDVEIPETPKVQYLVAEYIDDETDLDSTSEVLEENENRVEIAPSRRVLAKKINENDNIVPNKHVVLVKEIADKENDLNDDVIIEQPTHYYRYHDIENNKKYENNQPKVNKKAINNLKDCDVMATQKVKGKQQKTYKLSFIFN